MLRQPDLLPPAALTSNLKMQSMQASNSLLLLPVTYVIVIRCYDFLTLWEARGVWSGYVLSAVYLFGCI